ncbi:MAG: thioredoxin family protein [Bacteroidota bacterium]
MNPDRPFEYLKLLIANCKLRVSHCLLLIASFLLFSCSPVAPLAAEHTEPPTRLFEVLKDRDGSKMLKGILSKEQITQDTAFGWYAQNVKLTRPNADAVAAVAARADKISIIIFGGTWCEDTHQLLPKYLSLLEAAKFPDTRLTIVAVDRAKTTVGNLHQLFNITNVPTCIVMKDGKEFGRIVEFGKTTFVDKELGELVATVQ